MRKSSISENLENSLEFRMSYQNQALNNTHTKSYVGVWYTVLSQDHVK
jgi:hypothetical protein